jgi:hypothetical protein
MKLSPAREEQLHHASEPRPRRMKSAAALRIIQETPELGLAGGPGGFRKHETLEIDAEIKNSDDQILQACSIPLHCLIFRQARLILR